MASTAKNTQTLQQALATIATQQKTIDAQGKQLEHDEKRSIALQTKVDSQAKTIDNHEQRIQQLEKALRKLMTSNGEAKVNEGRAAQLSTSFAANQKSTDNVDKDSFSNEEYIQAYCDYWGIQDLDEETRARRKAHMELWRREGKGAGA